MNLIIRSSGGRLTRAVAMFVETRIRAALGLLAARAEAIRVTLHERDDSPINPERGCRVQVLLPGLGPIVAWDSGPDRYLAITRACIRAGATARRATSRQRTRNR
jgi:ribosome-associated translation inhibitor RaiA